MELKRYLEVDSKTALEKIKSEHGEEALIISSDKVGNKTEVIVGVSKKEDAYEAPSKEKGRSEAFRHALEANSNVEIEKPSFWSSLQFLFSIPNWVHVLAIFYVEFLGETK